MGSEAVSIRGHRWQSLSPGRIPEWLEIGRRLLIWALQAVIFAFSGISSFLLRFDLSIPQGELAHLAYALPVWIVVKSIVFRIGRLDRGWWRGYISVRDIARIGLGNVAGSAVSYALIRSFAPAGVPRSVYLIDMMLCFLGTAGARATVRMVAETVRLNVRENGQRKRTLIYGAGDAGVSLVQEIRHNPSLPYHLIGFIDDDPPRTRLVIDGIKVLGGGASLAAIAGRHRVETVLIAIPSASGPQMTQILRHCQQAGVTYKTVPGLAEIIEGNRLAKQIRDVAVEDLLGRSPTRLDEEEISGRFAGKVILVTGAGGSIGSELCRQIARFRPEAIVGFEISETALFHLDLEIRLRFPEVPFHPQVGSVQNAQRLREVLEHHQPSILYHAAAYKHVPMMETHMFEALENNVFGTYATALAAAEHGIEDFVMISTDKAVRPTSIMGGTKRLAELAVNSLQNGGTRFVSVRFGNVLGSNGSVIPLFKKQIAAGGPVTVTHPEMQRYFMTIPEASQLVLQASTMGKGGEIFVLDMGEPVKIVDLARNLILLSGLRPDEDIRIEFTGVRPGEKLYEELHAFEESTATTSHEKIKTFIGPSVSYEEMRENIETLRRICSSRDTVQLIMQLKELVPEYNPSAHLLRHAFGEKSLREAIKAQAMVAAG